MSKQKYISRLNKKIISCRKCRLSKNRNKAVPGEGNLNAKIMFVGEAPGSKEDITGKPFQGVSGKFLDKLLKSSKLNRNDVFITSVIKCKPPKNRNPKSDEIKTCVKNYLLKQIKIINPKMIITLGNIPFKIFFHNKKLKNIHGKFVKKGNKTFFPTYHPSAGRRFPKIRKELENDFKKLAVFIKRNI